VLVLQHIRFGAWDKRGARRAPGWGLSDTNIVYIESNSNHQKGDGICRFIPFGIFVEGRRKKRGGSAVVHPEECDMTRAYLGENG